MTLFIAFALGHMMQAGAGYYILAFIIWTIHCKAHGKVEKLVEQYRCKCRDIKGANSD